MTTETQRKKRVVPTWLVVSGTVFIVVFTGVLLFRALFPQQWLQITGGVNQTAPDETPLQIAEVITVTAVTTAEGSGVVQPLQQATLMWETTGQVGGVHVAIGDRVEKDQILLSVDPNTVPQTIIQAQVDLINAENALEDLLNPTPLQIANAENAVARARDKLDSAQADFNAALNPAGQSLYDAVSDAELALFTARSNEQLANVSADQQSLASARVQTDQAYRTLQELQAIWDADVGNQTDALRTRIENAQAAYESALSSQRTLELRIDVDQQTQVDAVGKAETALQEAVANLNAALLGPDALNVETTRTALAVAEAELTDAEEALALLRAPDPDDVLAAQAAVLSARNTLDAMYVRAPFAGEIIDIGYRRGDLIDPAQFAAVVATTDELYLTMEVDEIKIAPMKVGQAAALEFDALPGVSLKGVVSQVGNQGFDSGGIIVYNVDVTLLETHPQLRLGMSADVQVVTDISDAALAVPLDALQFDDEGEYVTRIGPGGPTRINIITGDIVGEYAVVLAGDLTEGQRIIMEQRANTATGFGQFGPGREGGNRRGGPFGGN